MEASSFSSRFNASSIDARVDSSNRKSLEQCIKKDQAFFVYNAAHESSSIKSPDKSAWIRPIGFFSSLAAAKEHGAKVHDMDPGQEIRVMPTAKVFLIGSSKYEDTNTSLDMSLRQKEQDKANRLIEAAETRAANKIKEVKQRAEAREAGAIDLTRMNPRKDDISESSSLTNITNIKMAQTDSTINSTINSHSRQSVAHPSIRDIPQSLELRSQRYMVLAVIEDSEVRDEATKRRAAWWKLRSAKLRDLWCQRHNVSVNWNTTLETWLKSHPMPSLPDVPDDIPPLFIDPTWTSEVQQWCRERDEKLLDAEWLLFKGPDAHSETHQFDYSERLGDEYDIPPVVPEEEPALLAIGACETLDDAEDLARAAGSSKDLLHIDVFVCAMYAWGRISSRHETVTKRQPRQLDEVVPSIKHL